MKRYIIELNAQFIKSYQSKPRALKYAKSRADKDHCVRLWDFEEKDVIWDNEEQYAL